MSESAVHVVFATPSLSRQICFEGRNSAIAADRLLVAAGINADYCCLGGDPYLSKVRSKLATMFLEDFPTATDLFFIDDDVSYPPEKVLEFLRRPQDIVAGAYPLKCEGIEFPAKLMANAITGELIREDGLIAVSSIGTGFLRIKRRVIEQIAKTATPFVDIESDPKPPHKRTYKEIFQMGIGSDGKWYGEDVAFCARCTSLGITAWVDPKMRMTHRGTRLWEASLADHIGEYETLARQKVEARSKPNV